MLESFEVFPGLEINIEEMTGVIARAKRACYASGQKPRIDLAKPWLKYFEHHEGGWIYRDEYQGSYMAPGGETLSIIWNEMCIPVWQMFYAGGMVAPFEREDIAEITYKEILKPALKLFDDNFPVRGKDYYRIDAGSYRFAWQGDITRFGGPESICLEKRIIHDLIGKDFPNIEFSHLVFQQYVGGSIIKYKKIPAF